MTARAIPQSTNPRAGRAPRLAPGGALLVALLAGVACSTTPMAPPPSPTPVAYRVGAPDQLSVTVLPDPPIERLVVVRPDGMISIDLIGDVPAAGRTVEDIAAEIEERIARYKRGATVTVAIASAASSAITVLGEVRAPQTFALQKQTRAAEALGVVGGTTMFADRDDIRIIRSGGGEAAVFDVDLEAIEEGDLRTNLVLHGGDIIYVPPTLWAKVGYVIQSVLFPFQPLLGLGNAVAGTFIAQ